MGYRSASREMSRLTVNPAVPGMTSGRGGLVGGAINGDPRRVSKDTDIASPMKLPRSAWGETLKRTVAEFREDNLNHWGAALTYYAVLSVFPALLVMVSVVGLLANPERVTKILTDTVSQLGPDTAAKTFQGPIESITANRGAAGAMFLVGV